MKSKKTQTRPNRSFRVRADLLKKAKDNNIVVTQFLEQHLEEYFNGSARCPVCCKFFKV